MQKGEVKSETGTASLETWGGEGDRGRGRGGGREERRLRKGGGKRLTNWLPWIAFGQSHGPMARAVPGACPCPCPSRGLVPRRHLKERLGTDVSRGGRKNVYCLFSELLRCAGPFARQFTDSISFNHHNNPVRKVPRLPLRKLKLRVKQFS